MHKQFGFMTAVCLLFVGLGFASPSTATAQDQASGPTPPPNVLVIEREFLKPGKSGSIHEKSESAFVQAMKQANAQTHYISVNSLSGKSRSLFLIGYDSFAEWGKDLKMMQGNSAMAQQFDSAQQADGELLTSIDSGVFVFQPDKSVGGGINIGQTRFWEITRLKIRIGHDADWDALAKLHNSIYKTMPDAHWDLYDKYFGKDSGSMVLVFTPLKSLADIDAHRKAGKQAESAAGPGQMKKMGDLAASALESIETNLFAVDPKMSYARDNWKQADPSFWGQQ